MGGTAGLTLRLVYVFLVSLVVLLIFRGVLGVTLGLACCLRVGVGFGLRCVVG